MSVTQDSNKGLSYYTWPLIVCGMLLSVIIAGAYTITIAVATPAQLVENSPYEKGLEFNSTLKERARADKEKLISTHTLYRTKEGNLVFRIRTKDGHDMSGSDIKAYFMRPSDKNLDFVVDMTPQKAKNSYAATLPVDKKGLWYAAVKITDKHKQTSSYRYELTSP